MRARLVYRDIRVCYINYKFVHYYLLHICIKMEYNPQNHFSQN